MEDSTIQEKHIHAIVAHVKPKEGTSRYENKESLPSILKLRATTVYPSYEESTIGYWVGNTARDFKNSDEPHIPVTLPGSWMSRNPRSILIPQGNKYIQYKGTGDPDKPNFPPKINTTEDDPGHQIIWTVSADEVSHVRRKAAISQEVEYYMHQLSR